MTPASKFHPITCLWWGGWLTPRPDRFTLGNDAVPIVKQAGCAPGTVRTVAENLAPTGVLFPHCPSRSKLPHRLWY